MSQRTENRIECPHCTYRFEEPDTYCELNEEFFCPQCNCPFYVSCTEPLEFDKRPAYDTRLPYVSEIGLVTEGITIHLEELEGLSVLAEIARRQGLDQLKLRIRFPGRDVEAPVADVLQVR